MPQPAVAALIWSKDISAPPFNNHRLGFGVFFRIKNQLVSARQSISYAHLQKL
jgi:hypothetical protein